MSHTLAQKLIAEHRIGDGAAAPGDEIALHVDQTLTQDATGTLVMLEFEAMGLERVQTQLSAQYVDHNLLQTDEKNADDHLFLESACRRWGIWFSRPGNGVSHPLHMERFGVPGATLLGSDSHTCAAGALGMLAIGAGGLEVACAMAGEPFHLHMPRIIGVRLEGRLPDWVSAKDVVLEMLRRHGVAGGVGAVIEYHGDGLADLDAMDRHVIANMGAELGATTSVFPSDDVVRRFLRRQGRESDWQELRADPDATYDQTDTIDLGTLEPLIACPSSPGNVVPVREVAGTPIYQAYVGSSANPGFADFAVAAAIVAGRRIPPTVSFDVNPTSRQIFLALLREGCVETLLRAGARLHQAGCNGCIGMGQAPATGRASVRTVPRNFPGRSGAHEDQVFLCSPETAAASALRGEITDPRTLDMDDPRRDEPESILVVDDLLVPPNDDGAGAALVKGPNIQPLPDFDPLPETVRGPVLLKVGDDVSTDEIMPAGSRVLPFRSNIPAISRFVFSGVDETFYDRAMAHREAGGSVIVGGRNYGQGSSREHAALAPRHLGVRVVLARSFARIHWQNLVNFAILPLEFVDEADYERIRQGTDLELPNVRAALQDGRETVHVVDHGLGRTFEARHRFGARERRIVLEGSLIGVLARRGGGAEATAG